MKTTNLSVFHPCPVLLTVKIFARCANFSVGSQKKARRSTPRDGRSPPNWPILTQSRQVAKTPRHVSFAGRIETMSLGGFASLRLCVNPSSERFGDKLATACQQAQISTGCSLGKPIPHLVAARGRAGFIRGQRSELPHELRRAAGEFAGQVAARRRCCPADRRSRAGARAASRRPAKAAGRGLRPWWLQSARGGQLQQTGNSAARPVTARQARS